MHPPARNAKDWTIKLAVVQQPPIHLDLDLSRRAARRNLLPNRDRIVFIRDGKELLPGITEILTPGHSAGHMMFMLHAGGQQLCLTNDLTHHYAIIWRSRSSSSTPTHRRQTVSSIKEEGSDDACGRTILMIGVHFPWLGIGHVVTASVRARGDQEYPTTLRPMDTQCQAAGRKKPAVSPDFQDTVCANLGWTARARALTLNGRRIGASKPPAPSGRRH